MASLPLRTLPCAIYLRERLDYNPETGVFIWRSRPLEHFPNAALCGTWNTRYAGKPAGFRHGKGYRQISVDDIKYMTHRIAWAMEHDGPMPQDIDHIDGDRANNRIANLRAATRSENLANAMIARHNTSGAKGVHFNRYWGKFEAHITHHYKYYHLGKFDTLEQAAAARRKAAERLHGKFARHE